MVFFNHQPESVEMKSKSNGLQCGVVATVLQVGVIVFHETSGTGSPAQMPCL
jgi:hypothetical protein